VPAFKQPTASSGVAAPPAAAPGRMRGPPSPVQNGFAGFSSDGLPVAPSHGGGVSGRTRGPPSPVPGNYTAFGSDNLTGTPGAPAVSGSVPSEFVDGAVELSVRAREFVPKFALSGSTPIPSSGPPGLVRPGNAVPASQSNSGLLGSMGGLWSGTASGLGLGVGASMELNGQLDDIGGNPLMFPSGSNSGDPLAWSGLSDSSSSVLLGGDLHMPGSSQKSRLAAAAGPLGRQHISLDDEGDLDMDAALLDSSILGSLEDGSDLLLEGSGMRRRQHDSFLSSLSSAADASMRSGNYGLYMGSDSSKSGSSALQSSFDTNLR
jgi:hypothetical protein